MMRLFYFASAISATCAQWYAGPSASAGAGTEADPFNLFRAFTNTVQIQSGDTLNLLPGTYRGPGLYVTLSGVTVQPTSPNTFIEDGQRGELLTTLTSGTTANVLIANSESWRVAQEAIIGSELVQLQVKSGTNWTIVRGWSGTTAAAHNTGEGVRLAAPIIYVAGTNNQFRWLTIRGVESTNRNTGNPATNWIAAGIDIHGKGNKLINSIIHNTGHPAIGFWDQGNGGEVSGCIVWGTGSYNDNVSAIRGSGLYGQNGDGSVTIKNNIAFRTFTTGMKMFGETGPVKGAFFRENIFFDTPLYPTEASSGSTPTSNNWFIQNWIMGTPLLSYVSQSNTHQFFYSNVVVNGYIFVKETRNSAYTNNTFLLPKDSGVGGAVTFYESTQFNSNALNIEWDRNAYYLGQNSSQYNWGYEASDVSSQNAAGGGNLKFQNDSGKSWKDWSGWDANSTYQEGWPTNIQIVEARKTDYDALRSHAVVINTDTNTTNAVLQLGTLGFDAGDVYVLRDAQNYFTPITTATFSGTPINLPLNRTNVSEILGTLTHFTNVHTNVRYPGLFNSFVIERVPAVRRTKMKGIRLR
jgi:hypothetical protein